MKTKLYLSILLFGMMVVSTFAQNQELARLLSTPYIGKVVGASRANVIAFTVNEKGHRNIYVAEGTGYTVKKLTNFDSDDAQEITSMSITSDGKWIVFARGGDHGANSAPVATNSASFVDPTKIEVFSLSVADQRLYKIGTGDFPVLHPDQTAVSYFRSGQVWTASLDGERAAKQLFTMKGTAGNMQWSPDGTKLAFISRRGDYSFIGIYSTSDPRIQWIGPSFYADSSPQWSPDGRHIAFVRRDATGGALDSLTSFNYQGWSLMLASIDDGIAHEIYRAPLKKEATFPRISGQVNLSWVHQHYLTFMSYESGWPHVYRLEIGSNEVKQLTKGAFTIDNLNYSIDGKDIVFAANTGKEKYDFERSHIGRVNVESGKLEMLTEGEEIETAPFFFNQGQSIGFLSSSFNRAVHPKAYQLKNGQSKLIGTELFDAQGGNFVKPEQVFITAEDGIRFSAQYFKPAQKNKDLPALVYIHGGPRRQMYLGWHHIDYYFYDYIVNQYLVQQGYAVLSINYRMGTGYGFNFQHPESAGNLGASEYRDVLAAGKWLKQQVDIDPSKVGLFGGSYGGYLTAMGLAKNSDVFKAGVDIHGVHNRERKQNPAQYAPDFESATQLNWESSPSRWVDSWRSPVLIIHGDDDQNVAFSQSIDLYNRLKKQNVDVEVLVLPDENHHWQLFENLLKVKEATVDFLNRKLK
ncbi:MAG: prolyl oligopeptidase family serine peptidase [Sphingobacterium sp.]|jgi:dipeptidyl aminopeptidase/acylaminoacyl peptidase|nr:prolyl oligopeptidase family serine peptidase [Sphingobacterium sp.]